MDNLEKNILKSVYTFEEKRIKQYRRSLIITVITITLIAFGMFYYALVILNEQQTWSLLELFGEDKTVIKDNLSSVMSMFILELPKKEIIITVICIMILVTLSVIYLRNREKIQKKLIIIHKFFK